MTTKPVPKKPQPKPKREPDKEPDWQGKCDVCGNSPILPATGMCGPCTFGSADAIDGDW
jgi:hypothetical protein